ncbi:MAG: hypothetical protein R3A52_00750 [Polyangiales bacterium]
MILFTVPGATLLLAAVGIATWLPHALRDVRWVAGLVPASVDAPWARLAPRLGGPRGPTTTDAAPTR